MVLEKKIDAMADGRPKAPLYLVGWLDTGCPNRSCSFNTVLFKGCRPCRRPRKKKEVAEDIITETTGY